MAFCGEYEHTLDPKGRISVPAKFREQLGMGVDEVVVLRFYLEGEKCVTIYGYDEWERAREKIERDERLSDAERATLLHFYRRRPKLTSLDEQGRIVIPTEARQFAGLQKDVMIVGDGDKFHVMSREVYRGVDHRMESGAEANPNILRRVEF